MVTAPDALDARFGIDRLVRFDAGDGGLTRLVVTNEHADAHVYLHGAHVTHYQPCGQPAVLFMSERTEYATDRPIRGGVPVIFPWFGLNAADKTLPLHGFARGREWVVQDVARRESDGAVVATFVLHALAHPPASWPHKFALTYAVAVGRALEMSLTVRNEGKVPIRFEEALHPYFLIGDIRRIAIRGLTGTTFSDKTRNFVSVVDEADPLTFARTTDRVYQHTRATVTIDDPVIGRRIVVEKDASDTTVVWNPWEQPAEARPADLGFDEWERFVCVEAANARDHAITLAPGAEHTMTQRVRTEAM